MRVIAAAALALSLSAIGGVAAAQGEEEGLRTLAVQPRHRHHWHELSASIGVLPINAFVKGLTVGGNYTLHFNHLFAWEIVRAWGVVSEIETRLNGDLNELQLSPTPYEYPEWAATSSFVFTPFYGKLAVVNRALIFSEVFLVAGVGYGWLTNSQHVVIDMGLGARVFFGDYFSVRLDVRWEGFVAGELHNELSLMLGIAVHLG